MGSDPRRAWLPVGCFESLRATQAAQDEKGKVCYQIAQAPGFLFWVKTSSLAAAFHAKTGAGV